MERGLVAFLRGEGQLHFGLCSSGSLLQSAVSSEKESPVNESSPVVVSSEDEDL